MTAPDFHFIAAAHETAAAQWRESGSEAQRAFVPVLETWAARARARAAASEITEQLSLFGEQL